MSFTIVGSNATLSARAGLVAVTKLMRSCAQLPQVLDPSFPVTCGFSDSAIVQSYVSLLCQGITDFDAMENMRRDISFAHALQLSALPSAPTVRQRIQLRATDWLPCLFECNARLLQRAKVCPSALACGYVPLDIDTFVMDNSDSKKEGVSCTYMKVDGYAPIAAYLGNEGYLLELALRAGSQHSAKETPYTLERVLPLARKLTTAFILLRMDSGFDSAALYDALKAQRAEFGKLDWIVKWNPRKQDLNAILAARNADASTVWCELRPGKKFTVWRNTLADGSFRVLRLTVKTIDRDGQKLLFPELRLDGWNTTLERDDAEIITLYQGHGTHEQFHSELKTDMGLERLPSGKFAANDAICAMAMLAYNALRIIGQTGLIDEDSPVRHAADRRRIRTVIREMIAIPGQWIKHARQVILSIPQAWAGFTAFTRMMATFNALPS